MAPAFSPLLARYASAHYPRQIAECQGIPILGMNLSMSFGQNVLAMVYMKVGMAAAWGVVAACTLIFVVLFVACTFVVESKSPKPDKLSAEQRKVALQTGGEDADKFIDAACEELRSLLSQNKQQLWNEPVQFLVRQRLGNTVPHIREWNDLTHGQEYLDDLFSMLQAFPEKSEMFHSKFPHIGTLQQSELAVMSLDVESGLPARPTRSISGGSWNKGAQDEGTRGSLSPKSTSPNGVEVEV